MANFFTDIAPNVTFSKDPTAVIDSKTHCSLLAHHPLLYFDL
jgi:hypothetical protein